MSSTLRSIASSQTTGGFFVPINVADDLLYTSFTTPPSSGTGYVNAAGNVFNYTTAANAVSAAGTAFGSDTTLTANTLLRDLGDRYTFVAGGQHVAIFAAVQQMNTTGNSQEGSPTVTYTCIWSANPSGNCTVGVARI